MNLTTDIDRTTNAEGDIKSRLNGKLAAYFAAGGAMATALSSQAQAVQVGSLIEQPFGINGEVSIDFNSDGQIDFQIDHDRVNLNGTDLDYLQIDKNDVNGATNPLDFDPLPGFTATTFPPGANPTNNNDNVKYVIPTATASDYPAALTAGSSIGPTSNLNWQETANFLGGSNTLRANRLIDEDAGQIDQDAGATALIPTNGPNFIGLGGQVRYLGLQMNLNGAADFNYGWIGIRIDNEADATGAVVGYAYETNLGQRIIAGQIPEPATIMTAGFAAAALVGGRLFSRIKRGWSK